MLQASRTGATAVSQTGITEGGSFMTWSFPIGSVKGTVIRIHVTFLLFLLWIGGAHYAQGGAGDERRVALEV